jgi:protein TonB
MAFYQPSREMVIAGALSVGVHTVWLVQDAKAAHLRDVTPAEVILETYEAPPLPKIESPLPETKLVDNPKPEAASPKVTSKATQPATALPVAAQAGKTLTAADDAPAELADFTLVQGNGTEYVGGTTSAIGTNTQAVHGAASNKPRATAAIVGRVEAPALGPDRSRSPRPTGADWNCSRLFPQDPDAGDYAVVSIVVMVAADGSPKNVTVLRDPGHGFGAAARACAMSQRYSTGLNRDGQPTQATTPPITVRFTR